MSVVTVQLGQCGNQIGEQFFSSLMDDIAADPRHALCTKQQNEEYCEVSTERFFNATTNSKNSSPMLHARSVMVDMEAKVIAQTLAAAKRSHTWSFAPGQQFCQKRGSGNNWAHGFCEHGPKAKESIMSLVSREAEKCDRLAGFLPLLSLAGGTGSGVGAYVTQCLRDEYPHAFILNQVVAPYRMGEVIVQNYNAMLTLSHLYQTADAILLLDNDNLHKICSRLLNVKQVSFKELNKVISHNMASILQPCLNLDGQIIRNHLSTILEQMVAQPEYKLLTALNIPQMSEVSKQFSTFHWPSQLKHLRQMLIANAYMEEGIDWGVKASNQSRNFNRSVANMLFLRGADLATADTSGLQDPYLYTQWWPPSYAFKQVQHARGFAGYEKSSALLSNSQGAIWGIERTVDKAWNMFSARAYIHQYAKHGLGTDDFMDYFACIEQVIANYKTL